MDNALDQAVNLLKREDVIAAFQFLLGREPANNDVVEKYRKMPSLTHLRDILIKSPEFRMKYGAITPLVRPLNWERSHVDVQVSRDALARMIRHVEATWDELGRLEPHWSVLTNAKFRASAIGKNKEEFFRSGEIDLQKMRHSAGRHDIRIEDYKDCLELGCGVGRVTSWLAGVFPRVIATDISAPHLAIARETIAELTYQNVTFKKLHALVDLESLPEFDVFFSVIVLQHNPPPVIAQILRIVFGKLRPTGIGYFQIHTFEQGYKFFAKKYLNEVAVAWGRTMETHVLPQEALFALIEECGCQLLEIREDGQGAPTTISNRVLVRKRH